MKSSALTASTQFAPSIPVFCGTGVDEGVADERPEGIPTGAGLEPYKAR